MFARFIKQFFWWLLQRGWLPDVVLRWRVRRGLDGMVQDMDKEALDYADRVSKDKEFVEEVKGEPIAIHQQDANEQHYEVPAEFFRIVLGPQLKYSSCLFPSPSTTLTESEDHMLKLTCQRAELVDGLKVLDLGCGWGSLGLYVAAKFPNTEVTMLSNSAFQRKYIEGVAKERGLTNITVHTGDISVFENEAFNSCFDRVMSIEMFEHMKNYELLMKKIGGWLKDDGKLFVHIFTHKWKSYHFNKGWMAKTFFTGGTMPSHTLLLNFQKDLVIENQWGVGGVHYAKTLDAWLDRMDNNMDLVQPILHKTYGEDWMKWYINWRLFFIICSETFGFRDGSEWAVSHYLFSKDRKTKQ